MPLPGSAKVENARIDLDWVDESDRTFKGWITVDIKDKQGDRLDPEGFTAREYMVITQGPIQGTHSNIPIGRWDWIELKEKDGKKAWYGQAKIFKGVPDQDLEDYPVWKAYWDYVLQHHRNGKPVGLSIGGDPDYVNAPPKTVCDSGSCFRSVPKTYWYETSVVMSDRGPANAEATIAQVNAMAKALDEPRFSELLKIGSHIHLEKKAPSVTENPLEQGVVGRLAGDVGHIHPPSGMDREDPVDDDRRYPQQKLLPEANFKRIGEAFGRRSAAVAGRGIRGTRHARAGKTLSPIIAPSPKASDIKREYYPEANAMVKRYSREEKDDQYSSMSVKTATPLNPQPELEKVPDGNRSFAGGVENQDHKGQEFGALNLAAGATQRSSQLPQDFRDGGVPALGGAGVYKAQGERHGDFSPTDKEIADGTGLMLHGGRRYPHEAKRIQTGGMIAKNAAGAPSGGGTGVADQMDQENQQGMVGSMGNLRVSESAAKRVTKMDAEHALLQKAVRLKNTHGADLAKAVLMDELANEWGLPSFMAKGVACDIIEGRTASLQKALTAETLLRKDHSHVDGYAWDPDEQNARREYEREGTSGNLPSPGTNHPEWKPGDKTDKYSAHPKAPEDMMVDKNPPMNDHGIKKGGAAGVGEAAGKPQPESPHRDMVQKADKEDPPRPKGHDSPKDGGDSAAEGPGHKESGDGDSPPEATGEDGPEGEMPQSMDGAGPPDQMGETGLATSPEQMAPGQPDAATDSLPPGVSAAPGSMADAILGLMTPDELEGLMQLLAGIHKNATPSGSPMTTATPGAMQVQMGPTQRTPEPQR